MNKKVLLAGLTLFACVGAHAQSSVWLSGWVDLNLEHLTSNGNGSVTRLSSGGLNNSRFNLSGVEDLGGGNKAIFTIEPQFSAATGVQSAAFRQSYVGLKGNWGEVTMGRIQTPSYLIAGYADPTYSADMSLVSNMEFFYASYVVNNAIKYNTPKFLGFTGHFMYGTGVGNGTTSGRFLSTGADYRNGPIFLGGVSELLYTPNVFNASQIKTSRDNYFSAVYRYGGFEPTAIFHTYNGYYAYPPYVGFTSKGWDYQLGARWNIDGRNRVYFSYVHRHDDFNTTLGSANGEVVGYIYGLSKRTDLYAAFAHIQNAKNASLPYPVTFQDTPNAGQSPSGVQLGIRHAF